MSPENRNKRLELCAPPAIKEAIPPTVRVLEALLEERGDSKDLLFSLGCVLLRKSETTGAIDAFTRALSLDPEDAALHCNLGIAYREEERFDEASASLKRSILIDPGLELAFLHLAEAENARGETEAARSALESACALVGAGARPCYLLAEQCMAEDDKTEARKWYEEAFLRGDSSSELVARLGAFFFNDGLVHFEAGEFDEAQRVWGEGYQRHDRAFVSNQEVTKQLYELVQKFNEDEKLSEAVSTFRTAAADSLPDAAYDLALRFFFSLGRLPDLYVSKENIEKEFARWHEEIEKAGDEIIPYAHYRIGVLLTYTGAFDDAVSKLSYSCDHLPPSKHRPLRIEASLRFLKDLLGRTDDEVQTKEYVQSEWSSSGFADPFQYQAWSATGLSPTQARKWKDAGFSPKAAGVWKQSKAEPAVAREWQEAGFEDPDRVRRWIRGGFSIEAAKLWEPEFAERLELATQCRQAGFETPQEAAAWLEIFMFPWEAEAWSSLGFRPEEARVAIAEGIKDPFIAQQNKEAAALSEE